MLKIFLDTHRLGMVLKRLNLVKSGQTRTSSTQEKFGLALKRQESGQNWGTIEGSLNSMW